MEVWKIIFLSKWVFCRFHVNLPGCLLNLSHTVDGSEIRQAQLRLVVEIYHYLQGLDYIPGGAGFLPSTVPFMGRVRIVTYMNG